MAKHFTTIPDMVKRAQARSGDPKRNVWLSANAGSGKTHVLTERVIRLLLAGALPAHILCLTYTKAAASVMQTRIFERLSQWTRLDDGALECELIQLTGERVDALVLAQARRLFARALETPGGLKIQTIHAFCESILHQFPLEANIAGHFEMLDDMAALDLMRQARREVIEAAWMGEDENLTAAFELVLARVGESGLDALFAQAIAQREHLKPCLKQFEEKGRAIFGNAFGLAEGEDEESLARQLKRAAVFSDTEMALFDTYGGKVTADFAYSLRQLQKEQDVRQFIPRVMEAYFDSKGENLRSSKNILPKKLREAAPEMEARFAAKQELLAQLVEKLRVLQLIRLNEAAYQLMGRFEKTYRAFKRAHSLLDFDDLIHRTLALLKRSRASRWVHYKLDSAIAHILIDEAQDTSPAQWQIVRLLVEEFFAGQDSHERARTLFAVGDEKQSIYSFQGAVPEDFAASGVDFGKKARASGKIFEPLRLDFSFRSTPDILAAVDSVFSSEANYQGLSAAPAPTVHHSIRANSVGEVDIWAPLAPQGEDEPEDWRLPQREQIAPPAILARQIAETIETWIGRGEAIVGQGRLMRPGDIMVLVRSRDLFVHALSRELKNRQIAVAGSDRLRLDEHIAVRDLMALARFVLQPYDDLSLACVLKSPIFGLDEDELYQLRQFSEGGAQGNEEKRTERLAQALERLKSTNSKFDFAHAALKNYRALADIVPVYEFYSHVLSEDGGRRKILARLGHEASEVLDAFMDYTLAIQKKGLPGLQYFLETLAQAAPEIKRELGDGTDEVRIMTVHAAKGQEAAVVFLVDNGKAIWNAQRAPKLLKFKKGMMIWNPGKLTQTKAVEAALEVLKLRAEQEYRRLLYVGMTRAEDRLIVCGYRSERTPAGTWLDLVTKALAAKTVPLIPPPAHGVEAMRFRLNSGQLPLYQSPLAPLAPTPTARAPDFLFEKISPAPVRARPLIPSQADTLMFDEVEDSQSCASSPFFGLNSENKTSPSFAIRRGLVTHHLLQYLPDIDPEHRAQVAQNYLATKAADWPQEIRTATLNDIFALLDDARLRRLFAANSRAEVAIAGTLEIGAIPRPVSGQIDRLAVGEDEILLADFKTGTPPPGVQDVPRAYLLQMALYRRLLREIYPERTICALLIYTRDRPRIFELDNGKLDALLEKL